MPVGWWMAPGIRAVRNEMITWLRSRIVSGPIGIKDPRLAFMLPLWNEIYDVLGVEPRYIFCIRNPEQVARSLVKRDGMSQAEAEYRWLVYNVRAISGIAGQPVCVIPYEHWFETYDRCLMHLIQHLGLRWDPSDASLQALADNIVDPLLRHDTPGVRVQSFLRSLHGMIVNDASELKFGDTVRQTALNLSALERVTMPQFQQAAYRAAELQAQLSQRDATIAQLRKQLADANHNTQRHALATSS